MQTSLSKLRQSQTVLDYAIDDWSKPLRARINGQKLFDVARQYINSVVEVTNLISLLFYLKTKAIE